MKPTPQASVHPARWWRAAVSASVAGLLAACATAPEPPVALPAPLPAPAPAPAPLPPVAQPLPGGPASQATNERAYRRDAASHLYSLNRDRIYQGMLPPLLYAVGVMQVELDGRGNVRSFGWLRAPRHAPEVMAEIERTVRQAAPYPMPVRMGRVLYTETWLWDKSGRFQLDTLTEGQRSKL